MEDTLNIWLNNNKLLLITHFWFCAANLMQMAWDKICWTDVKSLFDMTIITMLRTDKL